MSILAPTGQSSTPPAGSPAPEGSAPGSGAGSQQQAPADWRASLPEDIRGHQALASYKDINALAKSHIHAQSMIGADKLVLPGKDATAEQRAEFYTKLGRPPAADGYEFKLPEGLSQDKLNMERLNGWRARFHEAGLTKAQGDSILSQFLSEEQGVAVAQAKSLEERLASDERVTKQKFGVKYDETINFVRLALNEFATPELYSAIESAGLGNNPAFVEAFAKIGQQLAGDGQPRGFGASNTTGGGVSSPEQAQAALAQIQ